MHAIHITPTFAAFNAQDDAGEPTVAGWYCRDAVADEWHGPFEDYAEAQSFLRYCEVEARLDDRHNRSLRYPGC